ncbi:MAG: ABC transporter substrate-binding protein [Oscillospiraceae bacterium]|nr:ABC transporter substrate-binding protein [Oscillospiraceae bacterium]
MKKFLAMLLALVMILGLFSACGGSGEPAKEEAKVDVPQETIIQAEGGTIEGTAAAKQVNNIRVALTNNSFDVSPFAGPSGARDWFVNNLYATLFCQPYFGASLEELQPWVAESYTKIDDLTYTIKLRENVVDNQGNKITADDVIFSYEMMYTHSQIAQIGTDMESMEKVNDYELTIKLAKSGVGIIENLLSNYRMSIVDKDWFEAASDEDKTMNPAVTGAYYIKEYVPGSSLIIEAVDNYWMSADDGCSAALQNVKTIEYTAIKEAAMRSIALENGEIDMTQVTATELQRFYDKGAKGGYNVLINGGNMFNVMLLNMDEKSTSPLAADINLRKAVLYAVNSEDYLYAAGNTEATSKVCYSMVSDAYAGFNEEWTKDYWNYDAAKAAECYAASGKKPGEVTLRLLSRTSTGDGVHSLLIAELEAAGFKVELMAVDQALFNTYKNDSSQWDICIDSKGTGSHAAQIWDEMFNPAGYQNGSVCFTHDEVLNEKLAAATTGDQAAVDAFHNYLIEIACSKGLIYTMKFTVAQDGILEMTPSACFNPRINAYVFADDYKSVSE